MNPNDPEYLNRLLKQLNPDVLRAAEATMLKGDIANLELERDAAVASTVQSYNGEIAPLRARLAELERIHAGEQVSLFKVGPVVAAFDIKCVPAVDGANAQQQFNDKLTEILNTGLTKDAFPNVQSNPDYSNNKPVLLFSDTVIPCSTDNKDADGETEDDYHTPKNAQVVTRDGQTFFVFKSAGYKAIAERLGFPYRPMMDGYKRYLLTPKEYDEVFKADQNRKSERRWRVIGGRPLEIDG